MHKSKTMKLIKFLAAVSAAVLIAVTVQAQTVLPPGWTAATNSSGQTVLTPPPGQALANLGGTNISNPVSFLESFTGYFTSHNPDLATVFLTATTNGYHGEFYIGAALQNNKNIGNVVGASYRASGNFTIEAVTLNDGLLNTIDTQELGAGYDIVIGGDVKLNGALLGGYRVATHQGYGAIALRLEKALTTHTFTGARVEVQTGGRSNYVPIVEAYTGFTF